MKKYILSLLAVLVMFLSPTVVFASSASASVSASNTVMLGNTVKVTVNLTSSSLIGSWQVSLNYDKNYLSLTSSTAEGGGTYMVNSSSTGTKSKSYTFTFKTLKSGSTKVSIGSAQLYDYNTMGNMSMSLGSKTISIKTKAEIEASYSDNANLKSLSIGSYELTPAFSKGTLEYSVEVENDVENVTISASKEDGNASISGTGDVALLEGSNRFEIVVTAQKGNTQKYVLNIIRKELEPVPVDVDGKEYILVRNVKAMPEYVGYELTTVGYKDYDIPALVNKTIDYTIVGLKDDDGNIKMYKFEKGEVTEEYIELKNGNSIITPIKLEEDELFSGTYELGDLSSTVKYDVYKVSGDYKILYALDINTGEKNYYLYNAKDGSFMIYDGSIEKVNNKTLEKYKYVIFGLIGLCGLFLLIILFRRPKSKGEKLSRKEKKELKKKLKEEKRKAQEAEELEEEMQEDEDTEEEASEDFEEEIEEEPEEEKELTKTVKVPIESERKEEIEIDEETEEVEEKEEKPAKKTREQKRLEKEEAKRKKKEEKATKKKSNEFDW